MIPYLKTCVDDSNNLSMCMMEMVVVLFYGTFDMQKGKQILIVCRNLTSDRLGKITGTQLYGDAEDQIGERVLKK